MTGFSRRDVCAAGVASLLAPCASAFAAAPPYDTANGEWRTYGGNLGSWRYSALDQIHAGNFGKLRQVWSFHPDNLGPVPDPNLQATPLMANGVLYLTAGSRRAAVALDPATGEMKWE